jgi:hypothetical protein
MIRYENGADWVEIAGAADMPMREAVAAQAGGIDALETIVKRLVAAWQMADWNGQPVTLHDVWGLSKRQIVWLRERLSDAVKDEQLDPEA